MSNLLSAGTALALDINTIILALIGMIGTSMTSYLAMRMAAIARDANETRAATSAAAGSIEKIHIAVNSERTAMLATIERLNTEILRLSGTVKTLEENKRSYDLAAAMAMVPPGMVVMQAPAPAPEPDGKSQP